MSPRSLRRWKNSKEHHEYDFYYNDFFRQLVQGGSLVFSILNTLSESLLSAASKMFS